MGERKKHFYVLEHLRDFEGKRKHDDIFSPFFLRVKKKQKKLLWLKKKTLKTFLHFSCFCRLSNSVSAIRTMGLLSKCAILHCICSWAAPWLPFMSRHHLRGLPKRCRVG